MRLAGLVGEIVGFTMFLRGFLVVLGLGGVGLRDGLRVLGRRRWPEEFEGSSGSGEVLEEKQRAVVGWVFPARMLAENVLVFS